MMNSLDVTSSGGIWISNKPTIFYDQKCILIYRKQWIVAICADSGKTLLKLEAHGDTITSLLVLKEHAVSPLLLTTSQDGTFKIWSLQKKEHNQKAKWDCLLLHTESAKVNGAAIVAAIAIVEKPGSFYLVTQLPSVKNYSASIEKAGKSTFETSKSDVLEVMEVSIRWETHAISFNGFVQSSGCFTSDEMTQGKSACSVETKSLFSYTTKAPVNSLATSDTGNFVAVAAGRELIVYARPYKAHIAFFHEAHIQCMCMHPLEKYIATGDSYGRITRWFCLSKSLFEQRSLPMMVKTLESGVHVQPNDVSLTDPTMDGFKTGGCVGALTLSENVSYPDDQKSSSFENVSSHLPDFEHPSIFRKICSTATVHWHSHAVNCLTFSLDGTYLLSGGEEAVLVMWMFEGGVEAGMRQFLPRLGAPLVHVTYDRRSPQYYAVACLDNSIKIIDAQYVKISQSLQGIDIPIHPQEWLEQANAFGCDDYDEEEMFSLDSSTLTVADFRPSMSFSAEKPWVEKPSSLFPLSQYPYVPKLLQPSPFRIQWLDRGGSHPASPLLLINTHGKRFQLYDSVADRHLLHFYTQKRHYISRVNHLFGAEWRITVVTFSSDGQTFVTASRRPNLCKEMMTALESMAHRHSFADLSQESQEKFVLHFWRLKRAAWNLFEEAAEVEETPPQAGVAPAAATDADFELQTRVDTPHTHTITALLAHPTETTYFISLSLDSQFKGWRWMPLRTPSTAPPAFAWMCVLVGSYKNLPCICGTLSMDGSVLAISQGNVITLWNPLQSNLIDCLVIPQPLQKEAKPEISLSPSVCCSHMGIVETTAGPFLVVATQNSIFMWNLIDYSICFSQYFQGIIDLLFVEPSGGLHFAVVSAYQEAQPTHQLDIFSIHPAHAALQKRPSLLPPCGVKCIYTEKRIEEETYILSGCFQSPASVAAAFPTHEAKTAVERERMEGSLCIYTGIICLTSAFELQTHRLVYSLPEGDSAFPPSSSFPLVRIPLLTALPRPAEPCYPEISPVVSADAINASKAVFLEGLEPLEAATGAPLPSALRLHLLGTDETEATVHPTHLCKTYLANCSRLATIVNPRRNLLQEMLARKGGPSHLAAPPAVTLRLLFKAYARETIPLPLDTFSKSTSETFSDISQPSLEFSSLDRLLTTPNTTFLQSIIDSALKTQNVILT